MQEHSSSLGRKLTRMRNASNDAGADRRCHQSRRKSLPLSNQSIGSRIIGQFLKVIFENSPVNVKQESISRY
jgi:hypothetical protein